MVWAVIVLAIAALVVYKMGVFRKPDVCKHCGKQISGPQQVILGRHGEKFVLCKQCAAPINSQIKETAIYKWCYEDFTDYLEWQKETEAQRAQFSPTFTYESPTPVMIDAVHGLFQVSGFGEILRFEDVASYHFNFVPTSGTTEDGKLIGKEKVEILMVRPAALLQHTLFSQSCAGEMKHPTPGAENKYVLSQGFGKIARMFSAAHTVELAIQDGKEIDRAKEIEDLVTAMLLFDFTDMMDVTVSNLEFRKKIFDNNMEEKKKDPELAKAGQLFESAAGYAYELLLKYAGKN